jgi:hypothetical protein
VDRRAFAVRLVVELHDLLDAAHGVAGAALLDLEDEPPPRLRPDDAVGCEPTATLERLDRRLRLRAEDPVDRDGVAACAQQLLQRTDGEPVAGALHERKRLDRV